MTLVLDVASMKYQITVFVPYHSIEGKPRITVSLSSDGRMYNCHPQPESVYMRVS